MEDSKIIELYWQRNEMAISETEQKYGNYCKTIASHILPDIEDARECVNDTYMAAWNAIPPNRPTILSTFLGKLTRRISIDRWRRLHAEKRGNGVTVALEELEECIPGGSDPARSVEVKELANAINAFLDMLPDLERRVFLMRYFDVANMQTICDCFHMSNSKARSMLFRIRKKMRTYLQKEEYL